MKTIRIHYPKSFKEMLKIMNTAKKELELKNKNRIKKHDDSKF